MSDITHADYCPEDRGRELEDCPTCMANLEKQRAYYEALYASEHHYSDDETRDCYSEPSERAKRNSLLGERL